MATRRRNLFAIAILVGASVSIALLLRPKNPYEQKLQHAYVEALERAKGRSPNGRINLTQVISEMREVAIATGTNAIPVLLDWIKEEPKESLVRNRLRVLGLRWHIKSQLFWRVVVGDSTRPFVAASVIGVFGHRGDWVIPELTKFDAGASLYSRVALDEIRGTGQAAPIEVEILTESPWTKVKP